MGIKAPYPPKGPYDLSQGFRVSVLRAKSSGFRIYIWFRCSYFDDPGLVVEDLGLRVATNRIAPPRA